MAYLIEVRLADQLTGAECQMIADRRARTDNHMPAFNYQWTPKKWCALAWLDGGVVSHAGIVERVIEVGGELISVGGICGVWTLPEYEGRGLGSAAVQAAMAFIRDELHLQFALLVCRKDLEPFYERLGWQRAEEPLTFEQPSGKVVWPMSTMVLSCQEKRWPNGAIDLRGLPW